MGWQQLQIKATAENADEISDVLMGLGSEAVTLLDAKDEPILEPGPGETPLWKEAWVCALLDQDLDVDAFIRDLKIILNEDHLDYHLVPLKDKNWTREWLEHFRPIQFGGKLWITPEEYLTDIEDKDAAIVILDPGLAFGTGSHPTTALCLSWLEKIINRNDIVIDYGCGSGILAIAAIKLGARKVFCVDNDPQALTAARENAKRNKLTNEQVIICLPQDLHKDLPKDSPHLKADVLVANILANPLVELAPTFFELVRKDGLIGLSGIFSSQVEGIRDVYSCSFELESPQLHESWAFISGRKL